MAKTVKYLEGLTIHKVPYNIANTSDFKTNVMGKAADNELFIITDTPTFSLKIGNVTYDGTSNVSATTATQSVSGLMSAADKKNCGKYVGHKRGKPQNIFGGAFYKSFSVAGGGFGHFGDKKRRKRI